MMISNVVAVSLGVENGNERETGECYEIDNK